MGTGDYKINELLVSTIETPSAGYRLGILNSDGEEKPKRDDPSESKHDNSGGGSDQKVSGEEGEFVNDGIGDVWRGSSKLKKSSHKAGDGLPSVWLGVVKRGCAHVPGCSGNPGRVSAGESAISGGANRLLQSGELRILD